MSGHRATYRRLSHNIWSVGCSCGWLCDHPLRGERSRAQGVWRTHRSEMETADLGRLARSRPVGARGGDVR